MVKKYGVNVLAVISCSIVLMAGTGCSKKISTVDNVLGEQGRGAQGSKIVEDAVYIQEASIADDRDTVAEGIYDSSSLVLKIDDIFFDFDKDTMRPDSYPILNRNIQSLKENPDKQIIIEGHTDERGTNDYNLTLKGKVNSIPQGNENSIVKVSIYQVVI